MTGNSPTADISINQQDLAAAFRRFIDPEYVITDNETQRVYECDGLAAYCEMPMITVLPESTEQVQQVLQLCHQYNVPVVARGAGTGLCAGATPNQYGVLLSMAKFSEILEIDEDARLARLQPGVRNLAISEAASEYGLYYAPDPSSQIACSIGGNVSENAGGVHCLKYGLTVHNVVQVKLLTVEGEAITLGNEGLESYGADLLALIHGSEGLLGVITEITVRLLPTPECAQVILAGFASVRAAGDAVGEVIARGIIPGGMEMMDSFAIQASEDFAQAGYPVEAKALLLCEVDGTFEEVSEHVETVAALLRELGATSVRISRDDEERMLLWKGRKSAFPALGKLTPDYYCMDGTIPRKYLAQVLENISKLSTKFGLRVANVFHAGDGNLHPIILYDANAPGELETAEKLGGKILELCIEAGGTITGEHGVGVEKLNQMCVQFSEAELNTFHAIKAAFDENELLNPGKAIPTLHRCAEFGAMHVHHGNLPHSNLPRF